jgi:hypothetical protein
MPTLVDVVEEPLDQGTAYSSRRRLSCIGDFVNAGAALVYSTRTLDAFAAASNA